MQCFQREKYQIKVYFIREIIRVIPSFVVAEELWCVKRKSKRLKIIFIKSWITNFVEATLFLMKIVIYGYWDIDIKIWLAVFYCMVITYSNWTAFWFKIEELVLQLSKYLFFGESQFGGKEYRLNFGIFSMVNVVGELLTEKSRFNSR